MRSTNEKATYIPLLLPISTNEKAPYIPLRLLMLEGSKLRLVAVILIYMFNTGIVSCTGKDEILFVLYMYVSKLHVGMYSFCF